MRRHDERSRNMQMFGRFLTLAAEYRAQGDRKGAARCLRNAQLAIDAEINAHCADAFFGDGDIPKFETSESRPPEPPADAGRRHVDPETFEPLGCKIEVIDKERGR